MRRKVTAIVIAVFVFGLIAAAAASLTVNSADLGAGETLVASCDTAVDVDYTTAYDATDSRFEVTEVIVSGVDDTACDTQVMNVTLYDSGGASLGSATPQTISSGTTSYTLTGFSADAGAVEGVAVVIAG